MSARRVVVDLGAIACWIVLWWISVTVGMELGKRMVGPEGRDGDLALTGLVGVILISPLRLACSTFFLWVKRRVVLFVFCAVPIGLAITLWPFLAGCSRGPPGEGGLGLRP